MPNTLSKMLREWFLECSKWNDFTKDKFVFDTINQYHHRQYKEDLMMHIIRQKKKMMDCLK